MSPTFTTQLEQVCRRRLWRQWLAASCWALAALLVAMLFLAGLDRGLRVADRAGRVMLTICLLGVGVSVARRWWQAISKCGASPLQIAQEVEQQHPELRDVVGNAWHFARQAESDPTAGSESLRRAVVLRATTAVEKVDWQQLVPRQPLRRAVLTLLSVLIVISTLRWFLPQSVETGFVRLTNPYNSAEWPREHDLQFVDPPALLAAGEDLVLQLRDSRGTLPEAVEVDFRSKHRGRWQVEQQTYAGNRKQLEVRAANVQGALQFRATGGDHQTMAWHSLEVVPPPRVEKLQLTVYPPAYTQLPARTWAAGEPIYAGSKLELHGRIDQPVEQVVLISAKGKQLTARVSKDNPDFSIMPTAWRVEQSDTYQLRITTASGLAVSAAKTIDLEVQTDHPPQVRWIEPIEDLVVLPGAAVPLVVEASDELALREINLLYHRSDQPQDNEKRVQLWKASADSSAGVVRKQQVGHVWSMAALTLRPGTVIQLHAEASDAKPSSGRTTRALRLNVVSDEQLWQQILRRQTQVVEQLAQLLLEQRELLSITAQWKARPEWSQERWSNVVHAALFRQRRLADSLGYGKQSVTDELAALQRTIQRNELWQAETAERLQIAQTVLQGLLAEPFPAIEEYLTGLARAPSTLMKSETAQPSLDRIAKSQTQVTEELARTIDILQPGNQVGRLRQELAAIEAEQQALTVHCRTTVAPQLLQEVQLSNELQLDLQRSVQQQRELARRLAEALLNIAQAAEQLIDEPTLTSRLGETVALAQNLGIQATMEAAANQLSHRRVGRSASLQQKTLEDLAKLRQRLAGKDVVARMDRLEQLRAAERGLRELQSQVSAIERRLRVLDNEQLQNELQRFRREGQQLAQKTSATASQLTALRLSRAAEAADQAAEKLREERFNSNTTKQARKQLERAQRELSAARRRQQIALARLEMAQLRAKLGLLLERQKLIQQEVSNFSPATDGRRGTTQQDLKRLTGQQGELREQTKAQAEQITTLPVFAHLLRRSGHTMRTVEMRLQQSQLGPSTISLIEEVVQQLSQLAEVLREEQEQLAETRRSGAGQGDEGDPPQEQTLQLALGQLRLLKSLQVELRERTLLSQDMQTAGEPLRFSIEELAEEQQSLMQLAREIALEPPDPTGDDELLEFDIQEQPALEE